MKLQQSSPTLERIEHHSQVPGSNTKVSRSHTCLRILSSPIWLFNTIPKIGLKFVMPAMVLHLSAGLTTRRFYMEIKFTFTEVKILLKEFSATCGLWI